MEKNTKQDTKRRSLLAGFGAAAAALVLAKTSSISPKSTDVVEANGPPGDSYRLTEHVKKYYRTTTI